VFIRIRGKLHYLWRAVDQHGTPQISLSGDRPPSGAGGRR
jgi:transposase-like protein